MFHVEHVDQAIRAAGATPPPGFSEKTVAHLEEVYRWNKVHDLTAVPPSEAVEKHVLDSVLPFIGFTPGPATVLDVGSGAGFPGLVLAAWWPEARVVLCEPLRKRRSFLETAAARVGLNVEIVEGPVEVMPDSPRFELVTSRATLPWEALIGATKRLVAPGGRLLGLVGPEQAPSEGDLERVAPGWKGSRRDFVLPGGARRAIFEIFSPAT